MQGAFRTAVLLIVLGLAGPAAARGHQPSPTRRHPDLTGIWTNLSLTALERPTEAKSLTLTDAEAADLEARLRNRRLHPAGDTLGQRDSELWPDAHLARIDGKARTSWLTSPTDGKLPYTTQGRQRLAAAQRSNLDNPEGRPDIERCLAPGWGAMGPPILAPNYDANYKIVQTAHDVVIVSEMNDEVRIIRLDGPHQPSVMNRRLGDSIGHFEHDTLVVETIGFQSTDSVSPWGLVTGPGTKVTERFTRLSPEEIRYRFTVEDPGLFSQAWTAEMPFRATKDQIYEFACHEGNYSMEAILAGARQADGRK